MARGKYETPPRPIPVLTWILVGLALLGTVIGGTAAYLSTSTAAVSNRFETSTLPSVTVLTDNSIKVENPGYAVYVRGSVTANWVNVDSGNILAQPPEEGVDYQLTTGQGWTQSNGFYYYTAPVPSGSATTPMVTVTSSKTKNGYKLVIKVMAQTVQAEGQTDGTSPVNAVVDAWGVQPENLP